jgi:hypothetical protein
VPWATPRAWAAGELVTAGNLNTYISDLLAYLKGSAGVVDIDNSLRATRLSAGTDLTTTAGDISANRGNGTGVIYLGSAARYLFQDGSNYSMPNTNLYVNGALVVTDTGGAVNIYSKVLHSPTIHTPTEYDPRIHNNAVIGGASYTMPSVSGNAGMWRFIKAWGQNLTIFLTNGTFILGTTQFGSGQYILANGDSVSCFCDGGNWWVM